jgi:ketosteroid isomerase-like protein
MPSSHEQQRERLARLFEDLGQGSGTSLRDVSAPDVSWWLPLRAAEHRGVADVEVALLSALTGRVAELQSVILGADGSCAVVEQLLRGADGTTTPATSVVTLRDGVVVAGRTYLDVAAWSDAGLEAQGA